MSMITQEKTMLYLTDLSFGISIQDIKDFLSNYQNKIIFINPDQNPRNKNNRKPLAMKVLFKDYESANQCRIEMNLRKLRGKSVRIMWDERDTSIRYNTKNNLFIKGIPKTTTPREVYEYFLQFGDISSCKINEDDFGNHNGYGYITYYNIDDAQKAIEETKDKTIFGTNNIEITHFQKKNERIINSNDSQKIYISNFPEKYNESDITKLCSEYGKVENCNIFLDNLAKKFGIIQFSSENEAKEALNKLNEKEIDGKKIMAKLFQTKYEHKQYLQNSTKRINEQNANCNLYIKNIPLTAKEEDLNRIFSKYGNVISVKIEKNKIEKKGDKGKFELVSKGFGYLSFDKPESAKNAIEDLNGKYLPGFESWNRTLIIELFMTKNERKFAENQHLNSTNYFINPNNPPYNYVGGFPYPYSYPLPGPMPPMSFNQYNNYGNNYNYGFKKNWRGGNKNNYRNNYRNNNYRGNKKNNNNNRQQKNDLNEENKEINKNKIDLTEYNKLEDEGEKLDFLGEKIFKAIEDSQIASERKIDINTISRITGMIIGLPDKNEIIEILENPNILNSRIEEALKLLEGKE
jgi:polyadenylate-binding protein